MRVCKRLHWRPRHASGSAALPLCISRSEFDKYSLARRVAHLLSMAVNAIYRRVFGYSIREEMTDVRDATVTFVLEIRMLLRGGSSRRSCVVFCCCVETRRENPSSSSFTGKSFIAPYGREQKKQSVLLSLSFSFCLAYLSTLPVTRRSRRSIFESRLRALVSLIDLASIGD